MLIDTHCHLNMEPFSADLNEVIANAHSAGVKYMQTICTHLDELPEILAIADANPNIFSSVGVHPHHAKEGNIPPIEQLIKLSKHPKIIAFGETGLDYYYPDQDISAQKESFANHIKAASNEKLPVIVHTRDAEEDTIDILSSNMKNNPYTGVIHCFTASEDFAFKALDLGLYISIAGIASFKNATSLQETLKKLPLDRILIETDAPYLAPVPMRGKRNEPAFVVHTAKFLADLFNKPLDDIIGITSFNAKALFSKANFEL